jgi:hypothetical protein
MIFPREDSARPPGWEERRRAQRNRARAEAARASLRGPEVSAPVRGRARLAVSPPSSRGNRLGGTTPGRRCRPVNSRGRPRPFRRFSALPSLRTTSRAIQSPPRRGRPGFTDASSPPGPLGAPPSKPRASPARSGTRCSFAKPDPDRSRTRRDHPKPRSSRLGRRRDHSHGRLERSGTRPPM